MIVNIALQLKVQATIELGRTRVKSQCLENSSSDTLSKLPMNIHRNYQRNLTRVFSVSSEMPSDSKQRFHIVVDKSISELASIFFRFLTHVFGFQNTKCPAVGNPVSYLYFKSNQGFWYFTGKKAKFCGIFRGKFTEKSADFAGKKSKFAEKSADFHGRKVKIRRNIIQFCGILAEKSQILKDFQGQILRKIGRFHRKFQGETSPRNNQ